jgi:hypothetical protein
MFSNLDIQSFRARPRASLDTVYDYCLAALAIRTASSLGAPLFQAMLVAMSRLWPFAQQIGASDTSSKKAAPSLPARLEHRSWVRFREGAGGAAISGS